MTGVGRLPLGGVRVEGVFVEDGAHIHLPEQRFEDGHEAVERLRQLALRARRLDRFPEALQRLPILVHQVALAPLLELAQASEQQRLLERFAPGLGPPHEFDEFPEFAPERERLFELGLERGEESSAVERGVEALSERDDRLAVAVAQKPVGGLKLRVNLRRLAQDRKSTRLNSSHANISYAVFCLKKKKTTTHID